MNTKECINKNQILRKKKECSNALFKVLFFASIALFLGSLVGQLYTTNQLAVKGQEMVDLESKRSSIAKNISEMELESSKYASLKYIEAEATKIGFEKNENYVATISPVTSTASLSTF